MQIRCIFDNISILFRCIENSTSFDDISTYHQKSIEIQKSIKIPSKCIEMHFFRRIIKITSKHHKKLSNFDGMSKKHRNTIKHHRLSIHRNPIKNASNLHRNSMTY